MLPYDVYSDTGLRENNEDCARVHHVLHESRHGLTSIVSGCLCDGAGGMARGELASSIGLDGFMRRVAQIQLHGCEETFAADALAQLRRTVETALQDANTAVLDAIKSNDSKGMASTLVAAIAIGRIVLLAWAGDSRAGLLDAQGFRWVTKDHTVASELVRNGLLSPEEAATDPQAHTITQHLGKARGFAPRIAVHVIESPCTLVLVSDGVSNACRDTEIASVLNTPNARPAKALVDRALMNGAADNSTAVVLRPGGMPTPESNRNLALGPHRGRRPALADIAKRSLACMRTIFPKSPHTLLRRSLSSRSWCCMFFTPTGGPRKCPSETLSGSVPTYATISRSRTIISPRPSISRSGRCRTGPSPSKTKVK